MENLLKETTILNYSHPMIKKDFLGELFTSGGTIADCIIPQSMRGVYLVFDNLGGTSVKAIIVPDSAVEA